MLQRVPFCPDPLRDAPSSRASNQRWLAVCFTLSSAVHGSLGLALPSAAALTPAPAYGPTEVFDLDPPPPPPPPALPDPPPVPTRSSEALPPTQRDPHPSPSSPVPPATAAAVLTAQDSAGPLDFTDTFVTGQATAFAGGATSSRGGTSPARPGFTSAAAVRTSGPGTATSRDRSQRASVVGGFAWSCPFPPAADSAGIDLALVQLRLRVGARGGLDAVAVLADPGYGFAEAARRCAAGKQFRPALNRDGLPVSSELVVRVRFTR